MKTTPSIRQALGTGIAVLLFTSSPALALDSELFIIRMMDAMDSLDTPIAFGDHEVDGDTVTADGFAFLTSRYGEELFAIDAPVVFSGVVEHEDGSFTADSMVVENINVTYDDYGVQTTIESGFARLDGIYIPPGELGFLQSLQIFETAELGPLSASFDGEEQVSLERFYATGSYEPDQQATELDKTVTGFGFDGLKARLQEGDVFHDELRSQGREFLEVDFFTEVAWDLRSGAADMRQFRIEGEGLGLFEAKATMSGATPQVIEIAVGIMDRANNAIDAGNYEEANSLQTQAAMALMPQVVLDTLELRYEDRGLMRAISGDAAALLGIFEPSDLFTEPGEEAPDLSADQEALGSFLANPGTLIVRSSKSDSLFELMMGALDPTRAIEKFGITLEAVPPADAGTAPRPGKDKDRT